MFNTLQGLEIEVVSKYKYLGVLIDGSLASCSVGLSCESIKVETGNFFFRVKYCLSLAARKRLIAATFLSVLDYSEIIYMQAPKHCLQALDSVYCGTLRFITNSKVLTHHCFCTLGLDGQRCHPVNLSIGTYLYIKSF